jgi:hypothetical protein
MNYHKKIMLFLFLFFILSQSFARAIVPDKMPEIIDRNYAVLLDGKKIGYVSYSQRVEDGLIVTVQKTHMTITGAGVSNVIITIDTRYETREGEPVRFERVKESDGATQKITGRFHEGKVIVTTSADPNKEHIITVPADTIMGEGLRLKQLKEGLNNGTVFKANVFTPALLYPVETTIRVGSVEEVHLLGTVLPLTEIKTETKTAVLNNTTYVDEKCYPRKMIIQVGGIVLEFIECDKEFASSKNHKIDLISKFIVKSPVVLADSNTVTYHILPIGRPNLLIPSTDNQIVRHGRDNEIIVTVKKQYFPIKGNFPYKGRDQKILDAAKPTEYLQSDHEEIVKLTYKDIGNSRNAAEAVKRIELFVSKYITDKRLSAGYMSAIEIARNRRGDCSEHAILTAAMCRAIGVPSRIVLGPKGHGNIFRGHAWVEAYISDRWIGLDATSIPCGVGPSSIALRIGNGSPDTFLDFASIPGSIKMSKVIMESHCLSSTKSI